MINSSNMRRNSVIDQRENNSPSLSKADDGNIGMIFALMVGVLFLFIGGAVDYSRWNAIRTDMLESMDAATLATAKIFEDDETLSSSEIDQIGNEFFKENFEYEDRLLPGWDVTFSIQSSGNIRTCMSGKIKTYLLPVADIDTMSMDKCVEITPEGSGRIELAMVLDVTGSMSYYAPGSSQSKIRDLKDAVDELLDVLYKPGETESDNVRLAVVPFNQHVNAGGASSWNNSSWGDVNANSYYHGYRFFHVDPLGNVAAGTKVNHYDLYRTDSNASWEGCVEARPYPLDELDTPPGSSLTAAYISSANNTPSVAEAPDASVRNAFTNAPSFSHGMTAAQLANSDNSRWVPVYLPDTADCNSYKECESSYNYDDDSGTAAGLYWDGEWFTDPDWDPVLTWVYESSYRNFNASNQRFIVGDRLITNHAFGGDDFEKYLPVVRHFRDVIQGTTTDADFSDWLANNRVTHRDQEYIVRMGYVGHWNLLTQTYDYKYDQTTGYGNANPGDCPPAITPLTNIRQDIEDAVGALYADGGTNIPNGAVWGWRVISPDAPFEESYGPGDTGPNNTTESDWQRAVLIMTDGSNDFADANVHWGSHPSAYGFEFEERMGDGVNEADSSSLSNDMEDMANDKLLRICHRMKQEGILVYTIVFDVTSGSTVENRMKSCATDSTSPYFFNASSGTDLEDAFGQIARDLVALHISQ